MPIDLDRIAISPLNDLHDRRGFRCDHRPIQNFCRGGLADAHRRGNLRAFVACEEGSRAVLGYYYLTTTSVEHDNVGPIERDRFMDLDKIPAVYLGMIGVHSNCCREGLGTRLMFDAFGKVLEIARLAGVWAMTLDASNQAAAEFYERFDFSRFREGGLEMYLPVGTIAALLED